MAVFFKVNHEKCHISITRGAMVPVLSDIPDQSFSPIDLKKKLETSLQYLMPQKKIKKIAV